MKEYLKITNECNMELMARYPDNHFDLAIVDPPYGIDIAKWDKIDMKPSAKYFEELFRISKNQIIWGANYFHLPHSQSWICWHKLNGLGKGLGTTSEFELAWTSHNNKARYFPYTYSGNIEGLNKPKPNYKAKKRIHPTQKPLQLYQWLLTNYAEPNFKILDTHLGSGSIAIAVDSVNKIEKMNLTLTACELDTEYYQTATQRIKEQTTWNSLF